MSSKLPTRREKPHSSKPYDRPKSFLQRVTKHVTDYLPSWLNPSSWVGGQSEKPPNEFSPDEETGEEEEDFDVAGPSGLSSPPVTQRGTSQRTSLASNTSTFTRKPLERSPPTSQQTLVNGDDHSDNSETSASTSGCSSLAPSQERKRAPAPEVRSSTQLKGLQVSKHHLEKIQKQLNSKPLFTIPGSETEQTPSTVSSPEVPPGLSGPVTDVAAVGASQRTNEKARKRVSVEQCASQNTEKDAETSSTRTSLWSEDDEKSSQTNKRPRAARPQPVAPNKRPCFSVSAFGSPLRIPHDKTLQSSETTMSPFYQGNTTYGGASAYKKARISTPYNSVLHAEAMKVRQIGSTGVLSSAAQKVLNILENMSTPLTDAKKIPVENISTDFALSYTPSIYARRPLRQDTSQSQSLSCGPPKTSYPIHHASASPHKPSPLLSMLSQTTTLSRTAETATPVSRTTSGPQEKRSGGAVRTRVSQTLRASKQQRGLEEEPAPAPDLPRVSLVPEGSIASFSFSIPTLTSTPIVESQPPVPKAKQQVPVIDLVVAENDDSQRTPQTDKFVFSSPIENKPPLDVVLDETLEKDNFQFRSPVFKSSFPSDNKQIAAAPCSVTKVPVVSFNFSASVASSSTSILKRKKPIEKSSSKDTEVEDGLRPASELIVGRSVMDILGKPAASAIQEKPASPVKTGFGSAFQKKATEWDCDVCMVRNKDTETCCVSCTSPRPSPRPTTNTLPPISSLSGFGSKFAPPSGSWSCPTCMINNTDTALNCVACSEAKPGAKMVTAASLPTNSPKSTPKVPEVPAGCPAQWTGPPVTSTAGTWECDTCLVRNKEGISKCCSCETPRANAPTTGVKETFTGFKFGQTAKDTSSTTSFKFGSTDAIPLKGVTSSSGFGLPKVDSKDTTAFKFGVPASSDSTPSSKLQEGFKFGSPVSKDTPGGPKSSEGFKFGVPVTKAPDSVGKPAFTFGSSTNVTSETGGFKFGLPAQPNFKADPKRTDQESKKSEVACEVVSSSTASTEVEGNAASCGDSKQTSKLGFVFGGQSASSEISDTTPTLTFGQKVAETSKTVLGTEKPVSKPEETGSEKKNAGITFGDSVAPKPAVVSEPNAAGQISTGGFKFGQSELKQGVTSSTSANSGSEKQSVKPVFNFGSPRVASDSGNKNVTAVDVPAPAVSSSFQFSFKGKESDSEQVKTGTTGSVFVAQQVSSTTTVGLSSFTTTTTTATSSVTPSVPSVTFGVTQPPFSTATSTAVNSVSSGAQNSTTPFVFGTPKPSQVPAPAAGGFTFSFGSSTPGNAGTAGKPASTNMPFTFGSTANSTSSVPPASAALFTFGKVDPAPAASNNGAQPQNTSVFTFGTPTNTANPSNSAGSAFGTPQASKPVFGFGTPGPASTPTPSLPAFGQPSSVGPAVTSEPFPFGSSSAMTNSTAPSAGGMFQMEAVKPVAPAPSLFRFGATQSEGGASQQQQPLFGAPQSQTGAFTFGNPTVPSTGPPFADNSPFVFGSAAASTGANSAQPAAASVPPFTFQAGNAASNPFSVAGNPNSAQRPIRKAIRRVAKKK